MENKVRIGIIGLGTIGKTHALTIAKHAIKGAELAAVHVRNEEQVKWVKENVGHHIQIYENEQAFFTSNKIDAVIIASPHYYHADQAILAFQHGLHVLCEKPAGVYTRQVRQMNEAALSSGKVFSMMFNQRMNPLYQKLQELISSGEIGEIRRMNWIITDWFRTQNYYDGGGWRATWAGEGGGVLINQSPHQLDLWQWVTGMMPTRVRAFCHFGKYHDIEVEDDVTAYVEYDNGATGVFVTSTGESPGTNRLEITGDLGKIVIEDDKLTFWRLRESAAAFIKSFKGSSFKQPECWRVDVPIKGKIVGDNKVEFDWGGAIQNWVDAIRKGIPLIAPGEEGIRGVTLSNAMLLSTWTDDWVSLPMDEDLFYNQLQERIKEAKEKRITQ